MPVFLDYQINLYTEQSKRRHNTAIGAQRMLSHAQIALFRRMPERFYAIVPTDVYGDGQLQDRAVFFQCVQGDALNPLDQAQSYQVSVRYRARAWIFFHTPVDEATFYNRAEVQVNLVDNYSDPDDSDFVPAVQETYTITP